MANVMKRYTNTPTPIYAKAVADSTYVSNAGDTWVSVGITKGTKISAEEDSFEDKSDAGTIATYDVIVKQVKVTTTFMGRESATRNFLQGTDGKYYQLAVGGAKLGTNLQEAWAFVGQFSKSWSHDMENGYTDGVTFGTLANASAVTVTWPTALTTATTIVIAAGAMYVTADISL